MNGRNHRMGKDLKHSYSIAYSDELYHFGILGMKWGVWNDETRARRTGSGKKARKQLTPEEIQLKKIKNAETRKKIWEGAKKVAAVTYDVAKIAGSIYLATQMSQIMVGQIINTSMQLSKITGMNEMINNGVRAMNDPNVQNALNTSMATFDSAERLANSPNFGATMAFLNNPNTMATANNAINSASYFGNSTLDTANQMAALGNASGISPSDYEALIKLANGG